MDIHQQQQMQACLLIVPGSIQRQRSWSRTWARRLAAVGGSSRILTTQCITNGQRCSSPPEVDASSGWGLFQVESGLRRIHMCRRALFRLVMYRIAEGRDQLLQGKMLVQD
jgi:hypothetical protein